MKKIVFGFIGLGLISSLNAKLPWSSESMDGIHSAFQQYDNFIQNENEKLKQKYISKQSLYKEILKNHQEKELHLRHITLFNIDSSLDKGNINFEYQKFKQLKNKQGDE